MEGDGFRYSIQRKHEEFKVQVRKNSLEKKISQKRKILICVQVNDEVEKLGSDLLTHYAERINSYVNQNYFTDDKKMGLVIDSLFHLNNLDFGELDRKMLAISESIVLSLITYINFGNLGNIRDIELDLISHFMDFLLKMSYSELSNANFNQLMTKIIHFCSSKSHLIDDIFIIEKAIIIVGNLVSELNVAEQADTLSEDFDLLISSAGHLNQQNMFIAEALIHLINKIFLFDLFMYLSIDCSGIVSFAMRNIEAISINEISPVLFSISIYLQYKETRTLCYDGEIFLIFILETLIRQKDVKATSLKIIIEILERRCSDILPFMRKNEGKLKYLLLENIQPSETERLSPVLRVYNILIKAELISWRDVSDLVGWLLGICELWSSSNWQELCRIVYFLNESFDKSNILAFVAFVENFDIQIIFFILKRKYDESAPLKLLTECQYLTESILGFWNSLLTNAEICKIFDRIDDQRFTSIEVSNISSYDFCIVKITKKLQLVRDVWEDNADCLDELLSGFGLYF
jgi:hypothetical protein